MFETSGAGGAGLTRFLYDGDELIAEYDAAGTLLRRYVHGSGVDDPIVWYEGASLAARRHLLANEQGSPIAISDASGALVQANAWDEYGLPNAANLGRFGYTGQIWLPELKLWHYKARAYSPGLGRFLQVDPVGYEDQVNLYAYVRNDGVNATDPKGLYECPECNSQELKALEAFVKGVRAAAKAKDATEALKAAATALGMKGDGGITVNYARLESGTLGEFSKDAITLDKVQIYKTAERVAEASGVSLIGAIFAVGAGVIAHEGSHVRTARYVG